jgi:hypothetical protein
MAAQSTTIAFCIEVLTVGGAEQMLLVQGASRQRGRPNGVYRPP